MNKISRYYALIPILCLPLFLVGCGDGGANNITNEQEIVTLVLSTGPTAGFEWGGEMLKAFVYEESGGTLILNHFPQNQLAGGNDRLAIEMTIFGDIDIAGSATSALVDLWPDLALFDTHFLFRNHEHAREHLGGEVGQYILSNMEDNGVRGMAFWEMGFRNLTNNLRPVHTPADASGMVIRTLENPLHIVAWNAFGANPTPMSFGEVFTALQQGTVDGQENPLTIIGQNAFYEVQDYIVMTQHVYVPQVMTMNIDSWNALSQFHQDVLTRGFQVVSPQQWIQSQVYENEIYEHIVNSGRSQLIHLTPDEHQQFVDAISASDALELIRNTMNNPHLLEQVLES